MFSHERITQEPNAPADLVPGVSDVLADVVHVARIPGLVFDSDIVSRQVVCG